MQKKNLNLVAKLPTVRLIGLSGSLALSASEEKDDIDVFIITEKNTVWLSRLLIAVFLFLKRLYRKRGDTNPAGKFCLNMVVGEDFHFPPVKRDIYTAHEIAQLHPLFDKDNAYQEFLNKNKWLLAYMPNVISKKNVKQLQRGIFGNFSIWIIYFLFLEKIAIWLQRAYMKNITREVIGNNILAFHPNDYRAKILKSYENAKK